MWNPFWSKMKDTFCTISQLPAGQFSQLKVHITKLEIMLYIAVSNIILSRIMHNTRHCDIKLVFIKNVEMIRWWLSPWSLHLSYIKGRQLKCWSFLIVGYKYIGPFRVTPGLVYVSPRSTIYRICKLWTSKAYLPLSTYVPFYNHDPLLVYWRSCDQQNCSRDSNLSISAYVECIFSSAS